MNWIVQLILLNIKNLRTNKFKIFVGIHELKRIIITKIQDPYIKNLRTSLHAIDLKTFIQEQIIIRLYWVKV